MTAWLPLSLLDEIAPLHLVFDARDLVLRTGRTFERIAPGGTGRPLDEVVEPVHPAMSPSAAALVAQAGRRLMVTLPGESEAGETPSPMRAVVHRLGAGSGLMLLAFGADVPAGVARHGLAGADLAELDPTIELLFLVEAQRALIGQHGRYAARLAEAGSRAERTALTDPLTGLANRRAVDRRLAELAEQGERVFGLMQLDLDHFKAVNDRLGHAAGDHVLTQVATVLREEVRAGDLVARIGGDEFLVLLEGCDDPDLLERIAARVVARVAQPMAFGGRRCRVTASIGATLASRHPRAGSDRLRSVVDRALYRAKHSGRDGFSLATGRAGAANTASDDCRGVNGHEGIDRPERPV